MKIKNMSKEELELLSYTDLTYMLLQEYGKPMSTPAIFKEICHLLEMSDQEYASRIGDYYTSLTIDKRFVWLSSNEWDIRDRHSVELVIDEDEELEENDEEVDEDEEEIPEEDIDSVLDDEDIDDVEEDMEDLSIMEEEEEDME